MTGLCLYHIASLILFYSASRNSSLQRTPIDIPLFAFLCVAGVSTIYAICTRMRGLIQFLTILIHYFNFYSLKKIKEEWFKEKFLNLIIFISFIFSLGFSLEFLLLRNLGIVKTTFLPNANLLGSFLNCGILIAASKLCLRPNSTLRTRCWMGLLILLIFIAECFLFSRGILIALGCGLLALFIPNRKKIVVPLSIFVALGLLFILSSPYVRQGFVNEIVSSLYNTRITIWKSAITAFLRKPIFGWGMGSFGQVYQLYKFPIGSDIGQYEKTTRFAHNEFLHIAVEMGVCGLLAYLWLISAILKSSYKQLKNSKETDWKVVAAFAVLVSLIIHSFFDFNLHLPLLSFLFVFLSAVAIPVSESAEDRLKISDRMIRIAKRYWLLPIFWFWLGTAFFVLVSQAFANVATFFQNIGQKNRAILAYKIATAFNPFYTVHLKARADLSQSEATEKLLKRAGRLNPGEDQLDAQLARYYFHQARYGESIAAYRQAIRKNPKFPFYFSELSDIYLLHHDLDQARSCIQSALRIEPLYVFAHYQLGEIYLLEGKKKEALNHYQNILKIRNAGLHPNSDYSKRLLDFDFQLAEKRIAELEKVLK